MSLSKRLGRAMVLGMISTWTPLVSANGQPGPLPSAYVSDRQASSRLTARDFVPDGNLGKPAWRAGNWIKMDRDAFSATTYPQATTEVASLWRPNYVYFAYRCKFTTLNLFEGKDTSKDFWTLWDRDVVEVFLNPQPERLNHYYEFEVAPNNLWIDLEIDLAKTPFNDAGWDSHFEHATHIEAGKRVWTCEMRIPVQSLGGIKPLQVNDQWRMNIFRADGPGDDAHRRFLSWSPVHSTKHSFHAPGSFGILRFEK